MQGVSDTSYPALTPRDLGCWGISCAASQSVCVQTVTPAELPIGVAECHWGQASGVRCGLGIIARDTPAHAPDQDGREQILILGRK
jgi:hypothetical protein